MNKIEAISAELDKQILKILREGRTVVTRDGIQEQVSPAPSAFQAAISRIAQVQATRMKVSSTPYGDVVAKVRSGRSA